MDHLREDVIISKKGATIFEKTPSSRLRSRRKRTCTRREFSSAYLGGLLQLRDEEVPLSDSLLEPISAEARLYVRLGKPAIHGNFLVDMTIRAADHALGSGNRGRRQDINPFSGD